MFAMRAFDFFAAPVFIALQLLVTLRAGDFNFSHASNSVVISPDFLQDSKTGHNRKGAVGKMNSALYWQGYEPVAPG